VEAIIVKIEVKFEPVILTLPREITAIRSEHARDEAVNDWLAGLFVSSVDGSPLDCGWRVTGKE
jgi:hypothetical protein